MYNIDRTNGTEGPSHDNNRTGIFIFGKPCNCQGKLHTGIGKQSCQGRGAGTFAETSLRSKKDIDPCLVKSFSLHIKGVG